MMRTTFKQFLAENTPQFLTDPQEIENWLIEIGLEKKWFRISPDSTVKVFKTVDIEYKNMERIPVQFSAVYNNADFSCAGNNLTTLAGCPRTIEAGDFDCGHNSLTSFEHLPDVVPYSYSLYANNNNVTSLDGINFEKKSWWRFVFDCEKIKRGGIGLIKVKGLKFIGNFNDSGSKSLLTPPFEIIKKYLGRPNDIFECQAELIEAGFEEHAQL